MPTKSYRSATPSATADSTAAARAPAAAAPAAASAGGSARLSTLAGIGHSEQTIRKSRFIGCVQPVADRAGAQAIVAGLWADHPAASHVCWALLAGGQSAAVDDGEPGGSAGRPMLEVLRHQGLDGVLATVVRYYGGIKLGSGGLMRAYTDCIAQALQGVGRKPIERLLQQRCRVPYALEGQLRRCIDLCGGRLVAITHDAEVACTIEIADSGLPALRQRLNDDTQGRIVWCDDDR